MTYDADGFDVDLKLERSGKVRSRNSKEPDWLFEITRANHLRNECDATLLIAIKGARKAGFPWQKIADAMGITQQGARQHWKSLVEAK